MRVERTTLRAVMVFSWVVTMSWEAEGLPAAPETGESVPREVRDWKRRMRSRKSGAEAPAPEVDEEAVVAESRREVRDQASPERVKTVGVKSYPAAMRVSSSEKTQETKGRPSWMTEEAAGGSEGERSTKLRVEPWLRKAMRLPEGDQATLSTHCMPELGKMATGLPNATRSKKGPASCSLRVRVSEM